MTAAIADELLKSIQDLIYETDETGIVTYANEAFAEILGRNALDSILGRNIREVYYCQDHRELFIKEMLARGGRVSDYMVVVRHSDSLKRYLSIDSNQVLDASGSIKVRGTGRDVTAKLEMFGAFFQCNCRGLVTFCNEAFAKLCGFHDEMDIIDHVNMDDLLVGTPMWDSLCTESASSLQRTAEVERIVRRKDNTRVMVLIRIHVLQPSAHAGVEGTMRDVTSERGMERQFQILLDKSMDGAYLIQDGVFRITSPGLCKILDRPRDEVQDAPFLQFVHPEDREAVDDQVQRKLQGESGESYDFRIMTRRNEVLEVRCNSTGTIHDAAPAVVGYLRDISKDVDARRGLERQVEIRTREKDELLELLIHELDAPIVGLRGTAELLLARLSRRELDRQDLTRRARNIYDISELSLMIVEGVGIAQERAPIQHQPEACRLRYDVIEAAMNYVKPLARNRRFDPAKIQYTERSPFPEMWLDKRLMQQVFFNLFRNSIKYAYRDPDAFEIEVEATIGAHSFLVDVRDYGIGIHTGDSERIFERATRGRNVGNRPGKGLGLFVVKRILDSMRIAISVTDNEFPTQFTLLLPMEIARIPERSRG